MEGDAGASRLNPNETDDSSSEVKAEDSAESEVGTDPDQHRRRRNRPDQH